jgi:hypothetical protein
LLLIIDQRLTLEQSLNFTKKEFNLLYKHQDGVVAQTLQSYFDSTEKIKKQVNPKGLFFMTQKGHIPTKNHVLIEVRKYMNYLATSIPGVTDHFHNFSSFEIIQTIVTKNAQNLPALPQAIAALPGAAPLLGALATLPGIGGVLATLATSPSWG